MLNPSARLAMSTSVLKALPSKLDIKRYSPSILYVRCVSTIYFKHYLLLNYCVEFHQTLQELSLDGPLSKMFKDFNSMQNSGCHGNHKENFKNLAKIYWVDLIRHKGLSILICRKALPPGSWISFSYA